MVENADENWKLKLRYGRVLTSFQHFTLLADGRIFDDSKKEAGKLGPAVMAMKVWALSQDEAFDMIEVIGEQLGFRTIGEIQLYESEPEEPPRTAPYGYSIEFTSYEED